MFQAGAPGRFFKRQAEADTKLNNTLFLACANEFNFAVKLTLSELSDNFFGNDLPRWFWSSFIIQTKGWVK
jgi:hypothetical protein